jgi:hypothetical protein
MDTGTRQLTQKIAAMSVKIKKRFRCQIHGHWDNRGSFLEGYSRDWIASMDYWNV